MRRVLLLAALCAAALAGCGGAEPPSSPAERAAQNAPGPVAEGDTRVVMEDFEFVPREVTVDAGDTIVWVNEGEAPHNAVAGAAAGPSSELFGPGGSYAWTAERPGTIPYVCTIHPGMEGTITVR